MSASDASAADTPLEPRDRFVSTLKRASPTPPPPSVDGRRALAPEVGDPWAPGAPRYRLLRNDAMRLRPPPAAAPPSTPWPPPPLPTLPAARPALSSWRWAAWRPRRRNTSAARATFSSSLASPSEPAPMPPPPHVPASAAMVARDDRVAADGTGDRLADRSDPRTARLDRDERNEREERDERDEGRDDDLFMDTRDARLLELWPPRPPARRRCELRDLAYRRRRDARPTRRDDAARAMRARRDGAEAWLPGEPGRGATTLPRGVGCCFSSSSPPSPPSLMGPPPTTTHELSVPHVRSGRSSSTSSSPSCCMSPPRCVLRSTRCNTCVGQHRLEMGLGAVRNVWPPSESSTVRWAPWLTVAHRSCMVNITHTQ